VLHGFGESSERWEIRASPAQEGDQRKAAADVTALADATGWRPVTSLADGMARTIAWARGAG
jgi:nucleoside-diphosphate-sugar epimerase